MDPQPLPDLAVGSRGPAVLQWQSYLRSKGCRDATGTLPVADGAYGPRTAQATDALRKKLNLAPTGRVDAELRDKIAATEADTQPEAQTPEMVPAVIQAKNFTRGRRMPILAIVIHTAECGEHMQAAENVGAFFAGSQAPKASAHYGVDADSVVRYVAEGDEAWHAGPVNPWTIGIELAGKAGQTAEQWEDDYSKATLARAAKLVAGLCSRYSIPIVRPELGEIMNRASGIYGHADVSKAYGSKGGHWDPGPSFPWQSFLEMVKSA